MVRTTWSFRSPVPSVGFATNAIPLQTTAYCLDIGTDIGSRVSQDSNEKGPFDFGSKFENAHMRDIK
jgi:hypothetical protein